MNHHEFYKSELSTKKTTASKKAFLTKSENQLNAHLKDLEQAKKNGPRGGMKFPYLHGEPVTPIRIVKIKTELQVIKNLKKTL